MASSGGDLGTLLDHHVQKAVCDTRAKYREGRRPRAVKVYTINLESQYLLIQGVPAVGAMKELVERFALYGTVEQYNALDEYPAEDFTEVYLIKFSHLQSARIAKRKMDEQSFFGGLLHVCYAPEFETVDETRKKLQGRKAYIARTTKSKDHYKNVRKKVVTENNDTKDLSQDFCSETSGLCVPFNAPGTLDPYSGELPLCSFSSQWTCSPWKHVDGVSYTSHDGRSHDETAEHSNCNNSLQKVQMETWKDSLAHPGAQKAMTSEAIDRFMPRPTQLQERKRRREDDHRLGTLLETHSTNEVLIGPQLPDISNIDMHDNSLNTTANLIRNKLKEVILPMPKPSEDKPEHVRTNYPLKQRRRI
ncbi:RNA-binding protein 48 [Rhynchocyon petersi]